MILCSFCNSQEFNSSIEETDEGTTCIRQYIDLEKYILKWLEQWNIDGKPCWNIFTTGKAASNFVKITYNFQTSDDQDLIEEDSITNCSSQQSTYIWSEAALYLLGPKPLFWCTLFAVNIREFKVTIELPCLCSDVYSTLLSRLTYLVYALYKYS